MRAWYNPNLSLCLVFVRLIAHCGCSVQGSSEANSATEGAQHCICTFLWLMSLCSRSRLQAGARDLGNSYRLTLISCIRDTPSIFVVHGKFLPFFLSPQSSRTRPIGKRITNSYQIAPSVVASSVPFVSILSRKRASKK